MQSSLFDRTGSCGISGNALLAPIGALNSGLAVEALCEVSVLSTSGLKVAGRVNIYVVVMRFRRETSVDKHNVRMPVDTLMDESGCSIDIDEAVGASHRMAVADMQDIHSVASNGAFRFSRIHQMRKLNDVTRCIFSMPLDPDQENMRVVEDTLRVSSLRYALLGQSVTSGVTMYIAKVFHQSFDEFWKAHSKQFNVFCIREAPCTYAFYVYDTRYRGEIDSVMQLLKQFARDHGIVDSTLRIIQRISNDRWSVELLRIGSEHSEVTLMSHTDPLVNEAVVSHVFSQLRIPIGSVQLRNDSDGSRVYVQMSSASSQLIVPKFAFRYAGLRFQLAFEKISHAPVPLSHKLVNSRNNAREHCSDEDGGERTSDVEP